VFRYTYRLTESNHYVYTTKKNIKRYVYILFTLCMYFSIRIGGVWLAKTIGVENGYVYGIIAGIASFAICLMAGLGVIMFRTDL
jgi:hypothetical protein